MEKETEQLLGGKMKKPNIILIGVLSLVVVVVLFIVFLYVYGFSISKPSYDAKYFTQKFLDKYSSPEIAFNYLVDAFISGDAEYYQEVLGRKMTARELKLFKPYKGKKPKIVKIEKGKDDAYIVTDNNWEEFFEKVNGRWVFTAEDWGANIRAFFRAFK